MSRITSFTIASYQRLKAPVTVPFDRLTFLCGPNSAGKSTIVDAMREARRYIRELCSHPTDFFAALGFDHFSGLSLSGNFSLEMIADADWMKNNDPGQEPTRLSKWSKQYSPSNNKLKLDFFHNKKIAIRFQKGEIAFYVEDNLLMSVSLLRWYRQGKEYKVPGEDSLLVQYSGPLKYVATHSRLNFDLLSKTKLSEDLLELAGVGEEDALPVAAHERWILEIGEDFLPENEKPLDAALFSDSDTSRYLGPFTHGGTGKSIFGDQFHSRNKDAERPHGSLAELEDYADLIQGLLLAFDNAVWPSIVPDSRHMLDSRNTFYSPKRLKEETSDVNSVILSFLAAEEQRRGEEFIYSRKKSTNPTPEGGGDGGGTEPPGLTNRLNHAIKSHMKSMNRFNLVVECFTSESSFEGLNTSEDIDRTGLVEFLEASKKNLPGPPPYDRYRLWVQEQLQGDKTRKLGFEDVGSGLSYCLPVLMTVQLEGVSLIQQPELHLHPAAQCELGDIFLSALYSGRPSVVETHSEHIILRVLRRIREHTEGYLLRPDLKANAEDVLVLYFEPAGDETMVHRIRVDQYGEFLDPWPSGFFSERENELFPEGLAS